jgi:hypothetical protein
MTALTAADQALARALREAVALQPVVEEALVELSRGADPEDRWVRAASRLAGRYWELLQELPTRTERARRVAILLDYHQQLLRHTMRFACSLDHLAVRPELSRRQASAGLGPPGAELREILRDLDAEAPTPD